MATVTRTFGTTLASAYVPVSGVNPTIEVLHLRDMIFDVDERLAIYLDTSQAIIDIGSFNIAKIPNLDGDESTVEEALALSKSEGESNKIGLRILTRKNNTGNWQEIAEFVLLNYGRKDYLDLRTKTGFPARLLEKNDALAVQLIDYGDGLLWDTDTITVNFAVSIEIEKKNNLEAFEARMAALELALNGKLTDVPAFSILGKNAGTGTIEVIPQNRFLIADDNNIITPPLPPSTYGSISIGGSKNGYAGLNFSQGLDNPTFMIGLNSKHSGVFCALPVPGWNWLYNDGNFSIFSAGTATEGTYLGFFKGLGSLPGYPNNRYPTTKTDHEVLYFSVGGLFSSYINASGMYVQISDKNKKENLRQTDDAEILNLLLNIPTYTYNFKNSDKRIRNLGPMAKDFYDAFGLGGDAEIESDNSPIIPSKMISTLDLVGVCMSAIKGLAKQVASLKKT